jgi:squalene synthase HpnC
MTAVALGHDALPSQAEVMAQAGKENFPVASLVLGRRRRHLMAIYGFARLVDDIGDEITADRTQALNSLEAELDTIYGGGRPTHPVMVTLSDTIKACNLPKAPFTRLIEANRQDQTVTRYDTYEQLLDYCRLSAAPVGELVLHVFGTATPERIALSDQVCNALQIVEHLQDLSEDYARGRVYMPREDLERYQCHEAQLADPAAHPQTKALIQFEAQRARGLLQQGAPLTKTLSGTPRLAVGGFIAGGRNALDKLEARANRLSFPTHLVRALFGR